MSNCSVLFTWPINLFQKGRVSVEGLTSTKCIQVLITSDILIFLYCQTIHGLLQKTNFAFVIAIVHGLTHTQWKIF
jgi:hypothetical protein